MWFSRRLPSVHLCLASLFAAIGTSAVCAGVGAQNFGTGPVSPIAQGEVPFAEPWAVRFSHVHDAMTKLDFSARQVRRVLDLRTSTGTWTGIEERLFHTASRTDRPERFQLQFLGIEGRTLTPAQHLDVEHVYRGQVGGIYHDTSFRIVDLNRATANYQFLYVGDAQRAQRLAYRMVVMSRLPGRSAWILDLDVATGYPLYRGEVDYLGRLVSEVEVVDFTHGSSASFPAGAWWWTPPPDVREFESPADALRSLSGNGPWFEPELLTIPPGYVPTASRVILNAYGQDPIATLGYTDGIDMIFVVEMVAGGSPLVAAHSIGIQRQDGLTRLVFRHGVREVHVIGKAAEVMLRMTTEGLYRQVLRN
jgi:hypothetical protein